MTRMRLESVAKETQRLQPIPQDTRNSTYHRRYRQFNLSLKIQAIQLITQNTGNSNTGTCNSSNSHIHVHVAPFDVHV